MLLPLQRSRPWCWTGKTQRHIRSGPGHPVVPVTTNPTSVVRRRRAPPEGVHAVLRRDNERGGLPRQESRLEVAPPRATTRRTPHQGVGVVIDLDDWRRIRAYGADWWGGHQVWTWTTPEASLGRWAS